MYDYFTTHSRLGTTRVWMPRVVKKLLTTDAAWELGVATTDCKCKKQWFLDNVATSGLGPSAVSKAMFQGSLKP